MAVGEGGGGVNRIITKFDPLLFGYGGILVYFVNNKIKFFLQVVFSLENATYFN